MVIDVIYATSSTFKRRENQVFVDECILTDGRPVSAVYSFQLRSIAIKEVLEVSLEAMVTEEVKAAYARLRVPCIVEHAGLIFDEYASQGYPGGLTKPMWNALAEHFVTETRSAGRGATAKAVVAYCDGKSVQTFTGETHGHLADSPRGNAAFYWDTVFVPDEENPQRLTYAEIVDDPSMGLPFKVKTLSQSSKAMLQFLDWRLTHTPELWEIVY